MSGRTSAAVRSGERTAAAVVPAAVGLALVEAAIGYEWLVSGLNKLLSPDFGSGLAHQLQTSLQGNPNQWYASIANMLVLPHARLFAVLIEVGEVLVALGLFAGAAFWLSGRFSTSSWARWLNLGAIFALVGGTLMSVNYAVMAGDTLPGIDPAKAFNEGLSIDSLLAIIGLGLLIIHAVAARIRGRTTVAV
jgi:thiosulfate dehydrogenase [quinone] large subunit